MKSPRIHVPPLEPGAQGEQVLVGDAANHLRVLRLRPGSPLVLFDGTGGEYQAELLALDRKQARVRLLSHQDVERESPLRLTLLQGVSKGDRMDWAIQKAVELGVSRILPVFTEHSVVNLKGERLQKKHHHWQGVVRSACEQCGRNRIPEVLPARHLLDSTAVLAEHAPSLLLDPAGGHPLPSIQLSASAPVALLVGPEGGFSDAELHWAREQGCTPILLGPRVLRTETAAVAALAAMQSLWGDLGAQ